jgi:hypothetical protein
MLPMFLAAVDPSWPTALPASSLLARIDGLMAQIAGRDERIDELLAQVIPIQGQGSSTRLPTA